MATTTAGAFDEFKDRISLTDAEQTKVRSRRDQAIKYVRDAFPSSSDMPCSSGVMIGSAKRGTAIRPLDDLDVMVKFANKDQVFEKYRFDSQAFLYRVRDALNAKTQIRQVGARGQAVRLFYKDGLHVDVAPVFKWSSGGYALPAGDGSWITTDPPAQEAWINKRQGELNNQLKKRVKFLKRWNNVHSHRLQSWHLEVMVATAFGSMSTNSRDGLMKFFEWAPGYIDVNDPDGYGGNLATYLAWGIRDEVRKSFDSAHDRAVKANAAEVRGDHREAIRLWRIILGDDFPAFSGA